MDDQPNSSSDIRGASKRLAEVSRQLVRAAQVHIERAEQRLDRARNARQVSVLWRALQEWRRRRQ
jgi:hypothetical protein